MSISLLGIINLRILCIKNAIHIQEKTFDININKVLHQIAQNLQQMIQLHFCLGTITLRHLKLIGNISLVNF